MDEIRPGENLGKVKIAVFSPWCATGGVEALHQITEALTALGYDVAMHYYNIGVGKLEFSDTVIRPEYAHYGCQIKKDDDYIWAIIPECRRDLVPTLQTAGKRVSFWHLGVGSWPEHSPDTHLACGTHAVGWCKSHGVEPVFVSDYLGKEFTTDSNLTVVKDKVVRYGWRSADKIFAIQTCVPEIKFEQISDLPANEVAEAMRRTSVFLEAGGSGGLDRMPREAATSGAAIVWLNTDPQFAVPSDYLTDKFHKCAAVLKLALQDPEFALLRQESYRSWIRAAETRFRAEVKSFADRYLV